MKGQWPGLIFPRIPSHEIAGVIEALGADVVDWRVGQCAGASIESQDTGFSALSGVRPMIGHYRWRGPEAYARMMRGDAPFRMVSTMA